MTATFYGRSDIQAVTVGGCGHSFKKLDRIESPLTELGLLDRAIPKIEVGDCPTCLAFFRSDPGFRESRAELAPMTPDEQELKRSRDEQGKTITGALMESLASIVGARDPLLAKQLRRTLDLPPKEANR